MGPIILNAGGGVTLTRSIEQCLGQNDSAGSRDVWFPAGEGKHVIDVNVRGRDVYIVSSPVDIKSSRSIYDNFIMANEAVDAAAQSDAQRITVVMPYYPGARQDKRKDRAREGISAGLFARFLQESGASRVVTVDIHNEAIAGMFNPTRCRLENVQSVKHFAQFMRDEQVLVDVVAAPDVGGLERARKFAAQFCAGLVAISKERDYSVPGTVSRSTLIGDVRGKHVLLVDDMIDTAGSIVSSVNELERAGAAGITVACTHALMSGPAWERMEDLYIRLGVRLFATNSCPQPTHRSFYKEFDLGSLLARVIANLHDGNSVTELQT